MERREHPRYRARFDALCSTGAAEGAGILADISYTGARLEEASLEPEVGSKVRLYVFVQPVSPFEITGEVVRQEGKSFAISFVIEDPEVQRLVDDVAAIVSS